MEKLNTKTRRRRLHPYPRPGTAAHATKPIVLVLFQPWTVTDGQHRKNGSKEVDHLHKHGICLDMTLVRRSHHTGFHFARLQNTYDRFIVQVLHGRRAIVTDSEHGFLLHNTTHCRFS